MDRNSALHDDFCAWTQEKRLCAGNSPALDIANFTEEIESMGRRDRREIKSRLTVLLTHLLKWQFQPEMRSAGWSGTIREQRKQIARKLRDSPSLRPIVDEILSEIYTDAREHAARETILPEADFPSDCAFTADDVLSESFLPE